MESRNRVSVSHDVREAPGVEASDYVAFTVEGGNR